jgi:dTDP-4-amino-4,6-dideoxy-D-glucose ammonia-lyase
MQKVHLGYKHNAGTEQHASIDHLDSKCQQICQLLSNDPFMSARQICSTLGLTVEEYKNMCMILRQDSQAQNFILNHGYGNKYWNNTVLPLLTSGSLHAAIDQTFQYPNRIGLYTGMSCMFYCNFCGRNPVAKYKASLESASLDFFTQIIDQDPRTDDYWQDRFRISGGLEPLTNRYLGQIISYGKSQGYKMQLYTNGYMLTEKYIESNPGILDLYAIRFSLYGVDAESASRVTRNNKSFDNIVTNVINYLNNSTNNVGLNWIILPGHANDVNRLIDIIAHINSQARRPLNFVTLREDFSQNVRVLSDLERQDLMQIFENIDEFKKQWPQTHWDFGYSLESLVHKKNTGHIKMINWQQMIPEGFPQVSVAVDVKGDIYSYHESGFLDRPGASRYIIGNIKNSSVHDQVKTFVEQKKKIKPYPQDLGFLDAFDHVVSELIIQAREDADFGVPWNQGPVSCR